MNDQSPPLTPDDLDNLAALMNAGGPNMWTRYASENFGLAWPVYAKRVVALLGAGNSYMHAAHEAFNMLSFSDMQDIIERRKQRDADQQTNHT